MAKKLLIIGNGFDIDLGLNTRYSDFAKSKYWDHLMENTYDIDDDLLDTLKIAKEKEAWFDIEKTMNDYARSLDERFFNEKIIEKDKNSFRNLSVALTKYLMDEQDKFSLSKDNYALKVLKLATEVGGFGYYTFNYTSLQKIANSCNLKIESNKITYVHGSLERNSIILGILTDPADQVFPEYSFLYKDNSRFYMSNNLYEDLDKATDIIFYGHSINGMDFPYFKDFFIKQSGLSGECKKKHITIFTYDDSSNMQIRNSIRNAQVDLTQLFNRNDFKIIQTKELYNEDKNEVQKYHEFEKRLMALEHSNEVFTVPDTPFDW